MKKMTLVCLCAALLSSACLGETDLGLSATGVDAGEETDDGEDFSASADDDEPDNDDDDVSNDDTSVDDDDDDTDRDRELDPVPEDPSSDPVEPDPTPLMPPAPPVVVEEEPAAEWPSANPPSAEPPVEYPQPQPQPQPNPEPESVPTPVQEPESAPEPEAPPPAEETDPPTEDPPSSEPSGDDVLTYDECAMDCETRGAECGVSETVSALFCEQLCSRYMFTAAEAQCLLDGTTSCDDLPQLLDEETAEAYVAECQAEGAVIAEDPIEETPASDGPLSRVECLDQCLGQMDECSDLIYDLEGAFYCAVVCVEFTPSQSEMDCVTGMSCEELIDTAALECFDEYVEPEPAPEPDPTTGAYVYRVELMREFTQFTLGQIAVDENGFNNGTMVISKVCSGSGNERQCVLELDGSQVWEFYAHAGPAGHAKEYSPGFVEDVGVDGICRSNGTFKVTVIEPDGTEFIAPTRMVKSPYGGCHIQVCPYGTPLPYAADRDGDGVANAVDCRPDDPSIRPRFINESESPEVPGDGIDSTCGGADDEDGHLVNIAGDTLTETVAFEFPVGSTVEESELLPRVGLVTQGCQFASVVHPVLGVPLSGFRCLAEVDGTAEEVRFNARFVTEADGVEHYIAGWVNAEGDCEKFTDAFARIGDTVVAEFDNDPGFTFGDVITSEARGNTCDAVWRPTTL